MSFNPNRSYAWMVTTLFVLMFWGLSHARQVYVSYETGADSHDGLSVATAFKNIQSAADISIPGDTVYVMNGTYGLDLTGWTAVVKITRSGNANEWIRYLNFPGHKPVLRFECALGFHVDGAAYIEIAGFEIRGDKLERTIAYALANKGKGDASLTCAGAVVFARGTWNAPVAPFPHHVIIRNNLIHHCGGGGIGVKNADYVTIADNIVHSNAWLAPSASSGIMTGWGYNSDNNTTDYKLIITGNLVYNNQTYVPWGVTNNYSDGNGIIIDSHDNHDQSGQSAYKGRSLVANNVAYNNGGSGMHAYRCGNVDFFNNTSYNNSQCPHAGGFAISIHMCQNSRIINNIMCAKTDKAMYLLAQMTNCVIDYNIYWGGNNVTHTGPNGKKANPLFVKITTDSTADFSLQAASPAIDFASASFAMKTDIRKAPRPHGIKPDAGAYEYGATPPVSVTQYSMRSSGSQNRAHRTDGYAVVPFNARGQLLSWSPASRNNTQGVLRLANGMVFYKDSFQSQTVTNVVLSVKK